MLQDLLLLELLPLVVAFVVTVLLVVALNPLAQHVGWLDNPDARKQHKAATPLTGGVAMLGGMLAGCVVDAFCPLALQLLVAMLALCLIGLVDDIVHLSPRCRLLLQGGVALALCLATGFRMTHLGHLFGTGELLLPGWLALALPVFCIMVAINAINMLDGVDGLAGGVLVVTLVWLAGLVAVSGADSTVPLQVAAAIGGYLCFNMRSPLRDKATVFMGDAGSTMLALVLVWQVLTHSQPVAGQSALAFPPVLGLWLMAIPLLDTGSLIIRRLLRGQHPFQAGRDHLHHLILRAGFNDRQAAIVVIAASCLISGLGAGLWWLGVPEVALLGLFLLGFLAYFYAIHHKRQVLGWCRRVLVWLRARRMLLRRAGAH